MWTRLACSSAEKPAVERTTTWCCLQLWHCCHHMGVVKNGGSHSKTHGFSMLSHGPVRLGVPAVPPWLRRPPFLASLKTDRKVRLPPVVTNFSGVIALTMTIRRCAKDSIRKRFATYTQEPWAPSWTGQATACKTLYGLRLSRTSPYAGRTCYGKKQTCTGSWISLLILL